MNNPIEWDKRPFAKFSLLLLTVLGFLLTAQAEAQSTVTTTAGDTSAGSLGDALNNAVGAGPSVNYTIGFNSGLANSTVNLTGSYPSLTYNSGVSLAVTAPNVTLDGGGLYSLFDVSGGGSLSLSGLTLQNGTVSVGASTSLVLSGVDSSATITGNGTVVANGLVTLSATNTYSGGTSIGAGTLTVDTGGTLGTGPVTNWATLNYIDNANAGSVSITNEGGGPATLNFFNTASAGSVSIYNTGSVNFYSSSTASYAWIYSGYNANTYFKGSSNAGWANIDSNNNDALYFLQDSNAASATIINQGGSNLYFENASSAANSNITNSSGSNLYFLGDGATTVATAASANITNTGNVYMENYSSAGSATLTTNSGGSVYFLGSASGGTAIFTVNGTGVLDISGETASSVTIGSLSGSGFVSMGSMDLNTGSNNMNTVFSGILSDGGESGGVSGSLTKAGTGTLGLSGDNSFSGGTTLAGGTLNLGNNNALGTGNLTLQAGTTLQAGLSNLAVANTVALNGNDTYDTNGLNSTLSGVLSGTGGLAVISSVAGGTLTLSGANNYSGGTTIAAGTLAVDTNGTLGSGGVTNSATLDYIDYANAGSVSITNQNLSTLNFFNNSSAGSATIVNNGDCHLYFYNTSSAADSNITNGSSSSIYFEGDSATSLATAGSAIITNNGVIYFDINSTAGNATLTTDSGGYVLFQSNSLGGAAAFTVNGTGFMDFSGNLASSVTIGSLAGSGFVSLGANNLTTGANGIDSDFSGVLSDGGYNGGTGGSLTKIGTGILTLSGDNAYTGGTDINGGTLVAANANAVGMGNVTVNSGTLQLSGPLTLNIGGNYTQAAGGTLQMGLGPIASQWDKLDVTGTATLAGTLKLEPYSGFEFHDFEILTIITATSVSGTFGTVMDGVLGGSVSVAYYPTDVVLDVTPNAPSFEALGTTTNQKNTGAALDTLSTHAPNSTLVTYLGMQANSALPGIFNQISPANLTPLYQMSFGIAQVEAGMVGQRLSQLFGNPGSNNLSWNGQSPMFAANLSGWDEAATTQDLQPERWGVFVNGLGNFGTVTGDGNGPGYQFSTGGMAAGMDHRFSKNFTGGLLLGYSSSGTRETTGMVNVTGGQAGFYGGWKQDAFHIEALAAAGLNSYTTQRAALGGTATGSAQGQQYSGQLSAGYDLKADRMKVTPFISGQYTSVGLNAFQEKGSMAPLSYGTQSEGCLNSDLGAAASYKWDLGGNVNLSPTVSAAWEHVYQGNLDSLNASLGSGGNFTVYGPATGTDAAVLDVGFNALFGKGFSAFVQYQDKVALTNYTQQSISGGVNLGF